MFYHNIDPVFFSILGLEIRYYGLMYIFGFLFAYFFINKYNKDFGLELSKEQVEDYIFYLIVGAILGARLGYVLIYEWPYFMLHPNEIIAVWHGGMSFHGGLIGAIIAGWLFCSKNKLSFLKMADISSMPLAFGLFLGRIGNFLNGELAGRVTDIPWCFKFKGYEGCRHPSQLYESSKNLLMFFVLFKAKEWKLPKGFMFGMFIVMYGILRFMIEFVREPDSQLGVYFGWMSMGQILCLAMVFFGAIFLYAVWKNDRKRM